MPSKVAIVTGSNKGIGLSIVKSLCKQFDGDVYLTSRSKERGEKAVKELESEGLKPKFHLLDVTDQGSITTLRDHIVKEYGGLDVFIHNAAIAFKKKDNAAFSKQASETIKANFDSTVNLGHAFLPIMNDEGRYVNLGSFVARMTLLKCGPEVQKFFKSSDLTEDQIVSKMREFVQFAQNGTHEANGYPESAYGMSKVGVHAITEVQAKKVKQLGKSNVLVNVANPGWVQTDMSSNSGDKTPDQGAETPVFLAFLPKGSDKPTGEYFSDKEIEKWNR